MILCLHQNLTIELIRPKLAVPCNINYQPKTHIPICDDETGYQMLQHRSYGAERYMQLLIGWELVGFVVSGDFSSSVY